MFSRRRGHYASPKHHNNIVDQNNHVMMFSPELGTFFVVVLLGLFMERFNVNRYCGQAFTPSYSTSALTPHRWAYRVDVHQHHCPLGMPCSTTQRQQRHRQQSIFALSPTSSTTMTSTRKCVTTLDESVMPASSKTIATPLPENYHLQLDPQGNLHCNPSHTTGSATAASTVLLKGLTPSLWSASYPLGTGIADVTANNQVKNSLFLHMNHDQEQAVLDCKLGELMCCHRLLACARTSRYWMGPHVGTTAQDVPFDTQFMLMELQSTHHVSSSSDDHMGESATAPQYALFLPLVDNGFRASLHYGNDKGSIEVVCLAESGDAAVKSSTMRALYVAVGDDPYQLLQMGFRHVAETTGSFQTLANKKVPAFLDQFGWCTWDAFYSKVTPEGVVKGVQSLRDGGVPPQTIILDDGWQQVTPTPPIDAQARNEQESSENDTALDKTSQEPNQESLFSVPGFFVEWVVNLYNKYVKRGSYGSPGVRIWNALAQTILKKELWNYFDTETDFHRQLNGFTANDKFENESTGYSLKRLVSTLKQQHDVKHVLCWHALHGYWRGVSEALGKSAGINVTQIIPQPSQTLLRVEPQLQWDPVGLWGVGLISNKEDLAKFYRMLHAPLIAAGVDGVKVDVQSGVSAAGGGVGGGPHLAELYTQAMEDSVSQRFVADNGAANCINCMCHSTENLYRYKHTSVARASDDFYPTRPESHTVHLINVAYNSLFIGEICQPDWDMFHSLHESAKLHAAARAVGGCSIYVSDAPGKHDIDLLRKLVLPDGSVLRARLPGRPTRDCLFADVGTDGVSALKVWNQNRHGGVVGAFNVQGVTWNFQTHDNEVVNAHPSPVTALVRPHDIESLRGTTGPFAMWQHQAQRMKLVHSGECALDVSLPHREWEIFTVVPVQTVVAHDGGDILWGPIGLATMLNSGGSVQDVGRLTHSSTTETVTEFSSRGPGRCVAYTNRRPARIELVPQEVNSSGNDEILPIDFGYQSESGEVSFLLPVETVTGTPHRIRVTWE